MSCSTTGEFFFNPKARMRFSFIKTNNIDSVDEKNENTTIDEIINFVASGGGTDVVMEQQNKQQKQKQQETNVEENNKDERNDDDDDDEEEIFPNDCQQLVWSYNFSKMYPDLIFYTRQYI